MSGYPVRLTRAALGPTLEDAYPVVNPKQQVGAAARNAYFWNIAGANLIVARSALIASWNSGSSAFDVAHQAEAWNPDGQQARPALTRIGAGNYTYLFAASYNDENGVGQAIALIAARLSDRKVLTAFSDRIEPRAWIDVSNPLLVQLRLWDSSGTLVDVPFWLEVF